MTGRGYYIRKTRTAPLVCQQIVEPDWAGVIRDLNRRGYAKRQIALAIDSTREVVYQCCGGIRPRGTSGQHSCCSIIQ